MHLHEHIKECVDDFWPVYLFWCFSFERLNGILGSYHTNNCNISVQITKRFLECEVYAPVNWPSEFVTLLKAFDYNKGSLNQAGINTSASADIVEVTSLPPIQESAFTSTDVAELEILINDGSTCSKALFLHLRCKAICKVWFGKPHASLINSYLSWICFYTTYQHNFKSVVFYYYSKLQASDWEWLC